MRDWFTNHTSKMFAAHFAPLADRPIRYLEIGVCQGVSMAWMAENVLKHPDSRAIGIDFWDMDPQPVRVGMAAIWEKMARERLAPFSEKVTLLKGRSPDILVGLQSGYAESFDIVYIDGDHHLFGVLLDSFLAWRLAKSGAVVVWDDAKMSAARANDHRPAVKEALEVFLREYAGRFKWIVNPGLDQVWVRKTT